MDEGPGTILSADDEEFLTELSDYLEILGNSSRLRILRLLEKRPLDARSISLEIETSYENTKKHLEKLLNAGLIIRKPGLGRETSKGVHPAWEYSPAPGMIQRIQRDLGVFSALPVHIKAASLHDRISAVRQRVSTELQACGKALLVMGGEWDGKLIPLSAPCVALGRGGDPDQPSIPECDAVSFPESYRSLTRISRPHALIRTRNDSCVIEDMESTGGTYINGKRVSDRDQIALKDGDRISLSMGEFALHLVFLDAGAPGEMQDA
ncbi:MAG: FHA domain-containing protein [Methanolinea sp.]|jgi:DNA-binding transcriptional ArsR family regulator